MHFLMLDYLLLYQRLKLVVARGAVIDFLMIDYLLLHQRPKPVVACALMAFLMISG